MIRRMSWFRAFAVLLGMSLSAGAQEVTPNNAALEEQVRLLRGQFISLEQAMAAQRAAQAEVQTRQATLENKIEARPASLVRRFADEGEAVTGGGACGSTAGCRSEGCFGGQCDNGWMHCWDEDKWVKLGVGLRTSFRTGQSLGTTAGEHGNDFNVDNTRIYISGQGHPNLGFELNTDINNAQGFGANGPNAFESGEMRILDAVIKVKLTDEINLWAGRMLPPSDRSNLSGPFYLNAWLFPYTQFGYNNIFQGRDDGVALWGQHGDGAFKWQIGLFDGENTGSPIGVGHPQSDKPLVAGRVVFNMLDPESGYYNSSTYYGEKDILALGASFMHRADQLTGAGGAGTTADHTSWNLDFLWEQQLDNCGVFTVEAAYYDFNDENGTSGGGSVQNPTGIFGDFANRQGESWFLLASYLMPTDIQLGCLNGRFQIMSRYQQYDHDSIGGVGGGISDQLDVQLNYILEGHNARLSAVWTSHDAAANGRDDLDALILGAQLQF